MPRVGTYPGVYPGSTTFPGATMQDGDITIQATPTPDRWSVTPHRTRWSVDPEETSMDNPILVTLGKKRYVGGTITETQGKDISGDTFTIALGASKTTPPTTGWVAGVSTQGATTASRTLLLLVDNTTPVGTYYVWGNVVDSPEVEPLLLQGPIEVA